MVATFEQDLEVRKLDPAVVALRSPVSKAVERELARLRATYAPGVADDVALAMHRVTQSLLHTSTLRAQELGCSGDSQGYLQALHTSSGSRSPPVSELSLRHRRPPG